MNTRDNAAYSQGYQAGYKAIRRATADQRLEYIAELEVKISAAIAEVERLTRERDTEFRAAHAAITERDAAKRIGAEQTIAAMRAIAECDALRELVIAVEWYCPMSNSSESCPWCESYRHMGHDADCPRLAYKKARAKAGKP